jgi:hypothetical protein
MVVAEQKYNHEKPVRTGDVTGEVRTKYRQNKVPELWQAALCYDELS